MSVTGLALGAFFGNFFLYGVLGRSPARGFMVGVIAAGLILGFNAAFPSVLAMH